MDNTFSNSEWSNKKDTYLRYTIRDNQGNCIGVKFNNGKQIECSIEERGKIKHRDFDMLSEIITFEEKGRFGKEKHQNLGVKVKVVADMVNGNT